MGKTKKKQITGANNSQRRLGKESEATKARRRKSMSKGIYRKINIHLTNLG